MMEKNEKPKPKEVLVWKDRHIPYNERTTASGLTFAGEYVRVKIR